MDKRYYETVFEVRVLSEDPIDSYGIKEIAYEITDGDLIGIFEQTRKIKLTGLEVVQRLKDFGSDSEFFGLDDQGNDLYEE